MEGQGVMGMVIKYINQVYKASTKIGYWVNKPKNLQGGCVVTYFGVALSIKQWFFFVFFNFESASISDLRKRRGGGVFIES